MQVFLDTNILLDYLKGEKINKFLPNLLTLACNKKIILLTTNQVKDEYLRNAISVKNQKINELGNSSMEMPAIKYKNQKNFENDVKKELKKISKKMNSQKESSLKEKKNFQTREVNIKKFFNLAIKFNEDKDILDKAYFRFLKGNPPRKNKEKGESFGDAINWELILREANKKDELIIVSKDSDYSQILYGEIKLNSLLISDWKNKSRKKIGILSSLGELINKVNNTEIADKELIIEEKENIKEDIIFQQDINKYEDDKIKTRLSPLKEYIKKIIINLSPREQKILEMRFGLVDGIAHTLEEVAQEFGINRKTVMKIEIEAMEKLRKFRSTHI